MGWVFSTLHEIVLLSTFYQWAQIPSTFSPDESIPHSPCSSMTFEHFPVCPHLRRSPQGWPEARGTAGFLFSLTRRLKIPLGYKLCYSFADPSS